MINEMKVQEKHSSLDFPVIGTQLYMLIKQTTGNKQIISSLSAQTVITSSLEFNFSRILHLHRVCFFFFLKKA